MKYYEKLVDMKCFTRQDVEKLTGNKETAKSLLNNYKKKGYIESVRRNLFVSISMEMGEPVADRFVIASHIVPEACVTHHSAFQFHGMTNQVFYELYVATPGNKKFSEFTYNGITYRYTASHLDMGVETKYDGMIRVTDLERTVIDSIEDINKIAGLEEVLNCIEAIPPRWLSAQKLVSYLKKYKKSGKGFLYKKMGYILEHFQEKIDAPHELFAECVKHISKSKQYFDESLKNRPGTYYDEKWKLYVPENLLFVISKGGMKFDTV